MLIGWQFAYQMPWIDDGYWLLLLAAPMLLFVGYHLAAARELRKQVTIPIVVLPPDNDWEHYTADRNIINEITSAVIRLRGTTVYQPSEPITYQLIRGFLRTPESHSIARLVPEFCVYRKESNR